MLFPKEQCVRFFPWYWHISDVISELLDPKNLAWFPFALMGHFKQIPTKRRWPRDSLRLTHAHVFSLGEAESFLNFSYLRFFDLLEPSNATCRYMLCIWFHLMVDPRVFRGLPWCNITWGYLDLPRGAEQTYVTPPLGLRQHPFGTFTPVIRAAVEYTFKCISMYWTPPKKVNFSTAKNMSSQKGNNQFPSSKYHFFRCERLVFWGELWV